MPPVKTEFALQDPLVLFSPTPRSRFLPPQIRLEQLLLLHGPYYYYYYYTAPTTTTTTTTRPLLLLLLQLQLLLRYYFDYGLKHTMPPKPSTAKDAEDAQKQRQTNLEIDLLKSAWIQKDRESPPSNGKQ